MRAVRCGVYTLDVVKEGEETLLARLGLKNLCRFSETDLECCTSSGVNSELLFVFFFHAQGPFGRYFLECWSVWISLFFWIWSG